MKTDLQTTLTRFGTDPQAGLTQAQVDENRRVHGANQFTLEPPVTLFQRVVESLQEPSLVILMIAAAISLALGIQSGHTLDGLAILAAVAIASGVTAYNEHQKAAEFAAIRRISDELPVRVIRAGSYTTLGSSDLVAGDLVEVQTGDRVPSDGLLVKGVELRIDESALTGEPEPVAKDADRPGLVGGSMVSEGHGTMVITAVGDASEWGKLRASVAADTTATPLQERLALLAHSIGRFGMAAAIITFGALMTQGLMSGQVTWPFSATTGKFLVDALVVAVTIVVVAVPEGLPLAVTASLAYSVRRMMKDNNLVRRLMACETMGAATVVCSDKTGTLTLNRMTVVAAWFGGAPVALKQPERTGADDRHPPPVDGALLQFIADVCAINSTARLVREEGRWRAAGNPTEGALLALMEAWDQDWATRREAAEVLHQKSFSSARKRMVTSVRTATGIRVLAKGATEYVVEHCDRWWSPGGPTPLDEKAREHLMTIQESYGDRALRCIALAARDGDATQVGDTIDVQEQGLILLGLVGIADPVRPEVPDQIRRCMGAGVAVKMVTGDSRVTAQAIAREVGLLQDDSIVLEGPEFREMTDEALLASMGRLRVLARSAPSDKVRLVKLLQSQGHVVAVTGDGTNDGPALRTADVGLSMGLSGTEVAKEASDIVLLDDNFASVVHAIRWGRGVFENIRKFLQFQLTVNVSALATAFFGALFGFHTPLTAIQLLWVNLIMDTLAALALALEPPGLELLKQPPHGRHVALVSRAMKINIMLMGLYMFAVLMVLLNLGGATQPHLTMVFNTFVFMQLFNEINCRTTKVNGHVLRGLMASRLFIGVWIGTALVQVALVQFFGSFMRTVPLNGAQWLQSVAIGATVLPIGSLLRWFTRSLPTAWIDDGEHLKAT